MKQRNLNDEFGAPKRSGDWYVWNAGQGGSQDVIVWKPGMRYAKHMGSGRLYPMADSQAKKLSKKRKEGLPLPKWRKPTDKIWQYCSGRGLTDHEIAEYVVSSPRLDDYLIFPIQEDKRIISWHARSIDGKKWLSAPESEGWVPTNRTCWGLDRVWPGEPAYITEGIFDAFFFEHGVAIMGRNLSGTQLMKVLDRNPSQVVFAPDRDKWLDTLTQWKTVLRDVWPGFQYRDLRPATKDWGELVQRGDRWDYRGD